MTMQQSEMTFNIGLLALSAGGFLFYLARKENFPCIKKLSAFVIILALLSLACTTFWTYRYWAAGVYERPLTQSLESK